MCEWSFDSRFVFFRGTQKINFKPAKVIELYWKYLEHLPIIKLSWNNVNNNVWYHSKSIIVLLMKVLILILNAVLITLTRNYMRNDIIIFAFTGNRRRKNCKIQKTWHFRNTTGCSRLEHLDKNFHCPSTFSIVVDSVNANLTYSSSPHKNSN